MNLSAKNGNANDLQQIEELSAETSQAIGEVKAISYNLRPYQLDRIGLTKAVEAIVRMGQAASAIDFRAEIDDIDDYFPKDSEINFYRIVQECVNNVIKHSGASAAFVNINRAGEILVLEVSDNGKGFTPHQPESKTGGFGLIGIAERAELLGGKVEIKSAPEQGTMIKIRLLRQEISLASEAT
jgi:signal transduction histidine kinase